MKTVDVYDSKTIYFHWITAAVILALWFIGQNIDSFPKGDPRVIVRSIHLTLGFILAVILVRRLKWRLTGGVRLPQATNGVFGKLSIWMHFLLYFVAVLTIVAGIAAVWIRGDSVFNLIHVPAFDPGNNQLREEVVDLHELLANSLLILAGVHALLAIWHHKIKKDGVLKRMWPSLQ